MTHEQLIEYRAAEDQVRRLLQAAAADMPERRIRMKPGDKSAFLKIKDKVYEFEIDLITPLPPGGKP